MPLDVTSNSELEKWFKRIAEAQADAWALKLYRAARKTILESVAMEMAQEIAEEEFMIRMEENFDAEIENGNNETGFQNSMAAAYSSGRYLAFIRNPKVKYLRYKAELDRRTTQLCRALHGSIHRASEAGVIMPPNHHLCRSIMEPYKPLPGELPEEGRTFYRKIDKIRKEDGFYNFKGLEKPNALYPVFKVFRVSDISPSRVEKILDKHTDRVRTALDRIDDRKVVANMRRELALPVNLMSSKANRVNSFTPRSIRAVSELTEYESNKIPEDARLELAELLARFLDDVDCYETAISLLEERGLI